LVDLIEVDVIVIVHDNELVKETPGKEETVVDKPDGGAFEDIDDLFIIIIIICFDFFVEDDGCNVGPVEIPTDSIDPSHILDVEHLDDLKDSVCDQCNTVLEQC
jgi:hypothetical protein